MTNRIGLILTAAAALAAIRPGLALAQPQLILAGGPIQVSSGEHAVLCASNYALKPVTATLEFRDALTEALMNLQTVTLAGAGANGQIQSVCEEIVISKPAELLMGLVRVTGEPPALRGLLVASLQVFGLGASAAPANFRYIALAPIPSVPGGCQ